ncbi:MAG TPA: acyl-CoA synthetase [Burkholderiales bacterium]|nr:acyl-CoA synthetase [Burkholderiales bacterium]
MPRPLGGQAQPPQAPEWIERPERSNTLALRLMAWVAMALGRPAARLLLYPICLYFLAFSARARSASREFLRRGLGRDADLADSFRHYHTFASTILDRVFLLNDQISRFDVRVHGAGIVDEMIAAGQGCVMLGAHLGSFEIVRSVGALRGLKVSMVMYEENARKMSAVLDAINPRHRMEIISLGRVDSILKVEAALARGEIVGMLADRTLRGGGTVTCTFLGKPARFPTGPIRIARMLKRPVALMFGLYLGGNRYEVHMERFADAAEGGGRERDPGIEELARRYAERLEYYCQLAPYNWFNFYDYWI